MDLATVMEVRLGLTSGISAPDTRMRQYLAALEESTAGGERFFSESLRENRVATAKMLLDMRDELRMAGWNGSVTDHAPRRMKDLAEVEKITHGHLVDGIAERLSKICAIIDTRSPMISEIRCLEDAGHLPHILRGLLEKLGARFACCPAIELANRGTNLRLVQDFLRQVDVSNENWNAQDDTVVFVSCSSEAALVLTATYLLRHHHPRPTLLTNDHEILFTNDLMKDLPSVCSDEERNTLLRQLLELLKIALEMRWESAFPTTLHKFLKHPNGPVRSELPDRLVECMLSIAKAGSIDWENAKESWHEEVRRSVDVDPDELTRQLAGLDRVIQEWILVEKYPGNAGIPGVALAETSRQVADWAHRQATTQRVAPLPPTRCWNSSTAWALWMDSLVRDQPESLHYSALAAVAEGFAEILTAIPTVGSGDLPMLFRQLALKMKVIGTWPLARRDYPAQGFSEVIKNAGAVVEPSDCIVWWGFSRESMPPTDHWSVDERQFLKESGVYLRSTETLIALEFLQAHRPFFAAQRRIVLFWPNQRNGTPLDPHPLLTRLVGAFSNIAIREIDSSGY